MTFREKLQKDCPDKIDARCGGGCHGCPHAYGYEKKADRPCRNGVISNAICWECWNRTIPGTEEPSIKPDLNALIERAATKKDISVTIFITGDSTHISVYPCPDPSEKKGNPVAEAYRLLVDNPGDRRALREAIDKLGEALE